MATPERRSRMREAERRYREKNAAVLREKSATYKAENRDKVLSYKATYRDENKEKLSAYRATRYAENRGSLLAENKAYRDANRDRLRDARSTPDRVAGKRSSKAKRRARSPAWIEASDCRAFYAMARRVSSCLGVEHHVDHVYPLNGKLVSGLHVPYNLRVIPAIINIKKSNRVELSE